MQIMVYLAPCDASDAPPTCNVGVFVVVSCRGIVDPIWMVSFSNETLRPKSTSGVGMDVRTSGTTPASCNVSVDIFFQV